VAVAACVDDNIGNITFEGEDASRLESNLCNLSINLTSESAGITDKLVTAVRLSSDKGTLDQSVKEFLVLSERVWKVAMHGIEQDPAIINDIDALYERVRSEIRPSIVAEPVVEKLMNLSIKFKDITEDEFHNIMRLLLPHHGKMTNWKSIAPEEDV
jgi:hypothetical protein